MAAPFIAGMPPDLSLPAGYVVRLRAVDPTTGNTVAGVTVTDFSIFVANVGSDSGAGLAYGPFMLVPGPGA